MHRLQTRLRNSFLSKNGTSRFYFGAVLGLLLIAVGCSSKRRDNGSSDVAETDNDLRQIAVNDQPQGIGTANSDQDETPNAELPNEQSTLEDARAALKAGEHELAGEKVRDYLLAHPDDVMGLFLAAQIEAACERYLGAVALLDEIPRDHPRAGLAALGQSADWMMAAGKWDESERRFMALLDKVPTSHTAHRRLAYLLNRSTLR